VLGIMPTTSIGSAAHEQISRQIVGVRSSRVDSDSNQFHHD
jgi:hypothetical protein